MRPFALALLAILSTVPAHAASVVSGSHYHSRFEGRPMACGGRFDQSEMTAASNRHPCGSVVRVTRGNQSVEVTITDRCGHCGIDLSLAAARKIGLHQIGRAPVLVERVD